MLVVIAYLRRRTNVLLSTLDVRQIRRRLGKRKASGMESNTCILSDHSPQGQPACAKSVHTCRAAASPCALGAARGRCPGAPANETASRAREEELRGASDSKKTRRKKLTGPRPEMV